MARGTTGTGRRLRAAPVVAVAAVLASGGQAVAAAHGGGAAAATGGGVISTVAGGVGGPDPGTNVGLTPCGVTFIHGHLYIAELTRRPETLSSGALREMTPATSMLTTPVGTGLAGPTGDGGPATSATLSTCGATEDASGNIVIADESTDEIRVVAASTGTFYGQPMTAGHIYAVAGDGAGGFAGDGGPATSAELSFPEGVTVDAGGNLVIADSGNARVRVVAASTGTFYGQPMTAGDIYTVAGDGQYVFSGDFGPATSAGMSVQTVALDHSGNLLIADFGNARIRVVAASTGTFYGQPMTAGDIYTVAGDGIGIYSGDGAPATSAGMDPEAAVADGTGNLVIADSGNNRIRVVAASTGTFYGQAMTAGDVYTVAGNGTAGFAGDRGVATSAELNFPRRVTVQSGNLVIADTLNNRVRVVAVRTGTVFGVAMTAGHIYTIAGTGAPVGYSGNGGPATSAELNFPDGVAAGPAGNLVIADHNNDRVRVAAGTSGTFYGIPMTAGDIYTVAGGGRVGVLGDGGPATHAHLQSPQEVTVDPAGNLVITDYVRIRVVADRTGTFYGIAMKAGYIYTVAGDGQFAFSGDFGPATKAGMGPGGVALDATGNLVIADGFNNRVRVVAERTGTFYGIAMTAGDIYTVAGYGPAGFSGDGGLALHAEMNSPAGVAVDPAGNLVIADYGNQRIRVVAERTGTFYGQAMTTGDIYTVAGNGTAGFAGDGGAATAAEMNGPENVKVDPAGNLVIADAGNERVRVAAETAGTFYGVAMTPGNIYTVAGDGHVGFAGDGGPATSAHFYLDDVALTAAGNLLIADGPDNRIRMVTR